MSATKLYSNLIKNDSTDHYASNKDGIWRSLEISESTYQHRKFVGDRLDRFATFMWRGANAWKSFGAFIVSEKQGDLQMFNGPSFSNSYSSPQFSPETGNLLGVTFKQQEISFKIGVYWINKQDYRHFLNWLDPSVINYLSFGDSSQYGYLVKLSKIGDSPKYVIGQDDQNNDVYYTELTLTWEVQGPTCARWFTPYTTTLNTTTNQFTITSTTVPKSDLETPFILNCGLSFSGSTYSGPYVLKAEITNKGTDATDDDWVELFNITLQNLTLTQTNTSNTNNSLIIKYDSENGLLFQQVGEKLELLNLLTTSTTGENIVKTLTAYKFYLPSALDTSYELGNIIIKFTLTGTGMSLNSTNTQWICYPRTNIA